MRKIKGQSIIEFVISAFALSILFIAIPIVAKIGTAQLKTQQAADYAAWRINSGVHLTDSSELTREVGQRFFSRTGSDVLSDRTADCDDASDQDMAGNSLVNWDKVQVNLHQVNEPYRGDTMKPLAKDYKLNSDGQKMVTVNVPLNTVTGIQSIPDSMILTASMQTLRNDWKANNFSEIKEKVKDSIYLKPYETVQVNLNKVYNTAVAKMGFEKKIQKDAIYKMDIVPKDRREEIK